MLYISTGLKSREVLWGLPQHDFRMPKIATFHPFAKPGRAPVGPPVVRETGADECFRSGPNQTVRKAVQPDNKAGRRNTETAVLAVFRGRSGVFEAVSKDFFAWGS